MMKKKVIQLVLAILVLAALVAALIFLRNTPETPAEAEPLPASETVYVLGGAGAETPEQAKITVDLRDENGNITGTDEYTLKKTEDNKYTIPGWENLPLDETALTTMRGNVTAMQAKRVVTENATAQELAAYGIDKPRSSLTVSGQTIVFGADAPGGEGIYVSTAKNGATAVYLVATFTAEPFTKPATSLISLNVTKAFDAEYKGFKEMTLSGANFAKPIVMKRTEKPEDETGTQAVSYSTHEITSPVQIPVTTGDASTKLTTAYGLVAAGVAAVADDPETLKSYGLDAPAAVMALTDDNPELSFTLSASAPLADGTVYAQKKGQPVIYKFTADQLPWMNLTTFDLMDKFVNMANIGEVKTLRITVSDFTGSVAADTIYEFNLSGEGDNMVITTGKGETLNLKNFRQFYQTVISAQYNTEVTLEETAHFPAPWSASLKFEFIYLDGRASDTVEFYKPGLPLKYLVVKNDRWGSASEGWYGYFAPERYVNRVIEDVRKVYAGEEVKAYF